MGFYENMLYGYICSNGAYVCVCVYFVGTFEYVCVCVCVCVLLSDQ